MRSGLFSDPLVRLAQIILLLASVLLSGCTTPGCAGDGCHEVTPAPTAVIKDGVCIGQVTRPELLQWEVPNGATATQVAFVVPTNASHLEAFVQVHRLAAGRYEGSLTDADGRAYLHMVSGGAWTGEQGADTGGPKSIHVDAPTAGTWTLHWSSDGTFSGMRVHVRAHVCV